MTIALNGINVVVGDGARTGVPLTRELKRDLKEHFRVLRGKDGRAPLAKESKRSSHGRGTKGGTTIISPFAR